MANRLTGPQAFKGAQWVLANLERIKSENMTRDHAARIMSGELGFTVAVGNVISLEQAAGVEWPSALAGARRASRAGRDTRGQLRTDLTTVARILRNSFDPNHTDPDVRLAHVALDEIVERADD